MALSGKLSIPEKLHVLLIAGYVGISGIFWFPGVPYPFFSIVKIAAFSVIVIMGIFNGLRVSKSEKNIVAGLAICACAFFVAKSLNSDLMEGVNGVRIYILPLFWLIALSGVKPKAYKFLLQCLTISLTLFAIVAIYPVAAYAGILPNYYPPSEFVPEYASDFDYALELGSIAGGGFAGQSTSWGIIVPGAALMLAALYSRADNRAISQNILVTILILLSIASVAVTSARGGSMALAAVWIYGLATGHRARYSILAMLFGFTVLWFVVGVFELLPENYFRGFELGGDSIDTVNTLTTGRVFTYIHALETFYSSPIIGVGEEAARYYGLAIHNTFLRILAEGGLVTFLPTMYLAYRLLALSLGNTNAQQVHNSATIKWPDARLVVLVCLILANFEPGTVFGNFNASSTFWTAVWLTLRRPTNNEQNRQDL